MKTIPHCQESLCNSYLTAIAARARHQIRLAPWEHDYGVDGTFTLVEARGKKNRLFQTGHSIDFQAKASFDWAEEQSEIVYDLESKSYNDLIARSKATRATPFLLVLFCLPPKEDQWITISEQNLVMQRCAYFHKPSGGLTKNGSTIRIRIPRTNQLTPTAVVDLLNSVKNGTLTP